MEVSDQKGPFQESQQAAFSDSQESEDDFGDFEEANTEEDFGNFEEPSQTLELDQEGRPLSKLSVAKEFSLNGLLEELQVNQEKWEELESPELPRTPSGSQSASSEPLSKRLQDLQNSLGPESDQTSFQSPDPQLAETLRAQTLYFCEKLWPRLSIREVFLKYTELAEKPQNFEDLPVMTEADEEIPNKLLAKEVLGEPLPDLAFMLAKSIQWPEEYLESVVN